VEDPKWPKLELKPVKWARFSGEAMLTCVIGGFASDRDSEFDRITCHLKPWANRSGNLNALASRSPAAPLRSPGSVADLSPSPWRGFGGASVVHRGYIVGTVIGDEGPSRLLVYPASKFASSREFARAVRAHTGEQVELEDIRGDEPSVAADQAIDALASADTANTQQIAASQLTLSNAYYRSVLSQANRSFLAAIVSAAIGLAFFIGAVAFALIGPPSNAAIISIIAGSVVEVISGLNFWLYSRTSTQLESFHIRLEQTQRYLLANSVAFGLTAEGARDDALGRLVSAIAIAGDSRDEATNE
jgi:hypothetical protein